MKNLLSQLICFLFGLQSIYCQNVIYVKAGQNTGAFTGTSWSDSYQDLQIAIREAKPNDQIWVAKGTYLPTKDSARDSTFLLKSGVKIYGGFAGNEASLLQRDFKLNSSILSGDVGVVADTSDNSYTVVTAINVDSTCVLDGFTIRLGQAIHTVQFPINQRNSGGGMYITSSEEKAPTLTNLTFERNNARYGGGLFSSTSINLTNCTFKLNYSNYNGGGIYLLSSSYSQYNFVNCNFTDNFAKFLGGGLGAFGVQKRLTIKNCQFERNNCYNADGLSIFFDNFSDDTLDIQKCRFSFHTRELYTSESNGYLVSLFPISGNLADRLYFHMDSSLFYFNKMKSGASSMINVYMDNSENYKVEISNSVFENNRASFGCLRVNFNNSSGNATVNKCQFLNNKVFSSKNGGGIAFDSEFMNANQINTFAVNNCVFAKNDGAFIMINPEGKAYAKINNCTFFKNGEYPFYKTDEFTNENKSVNKIYLNNCIVWEPYVNEFLRKFYHIFRSTDVWSSYPQLDYYITNSLISIKDSCHYNNNPSWVCENIIYNEYPQFKDTAINGFELRPCSRAVNKGSRYIVDSLGILVDLLGNPRIFQDSVDMGAYESQEKCTVGTAELDQEPLAILLKPNICAPATTIHLELNPNFENYQIKIFDSSGQLYSQSELVQRGFEAPSAPGFYVVQVFDVHKQVVGVTKLVVIL